MNRNRAGRDSLPGLGPEASKTLLPCDALRQVRDNRQLKSFALIGFDHQKNPENKRGQVDQVQEQDTGSKKVKPARKQANPEKHPQGDGDDMETPEDNDGLRGMEFDERTFVDEKKDNAREPAQYIAESASGVFR